MELESEEADFSAVTDDPKPDFEQLAAAALDNAGINPQDRHHAAQAAHTAAEAARAAAAAVFEQDGGPLWLRPIRTGSYTRLRLIYRIQALSGETLSQLTSHHPPRWGRLSLTWQTTQSNF